MNSMMTIPEQDLEHVRSMLKKGVVKNDETGLNYFTGYHNTTLYDWDQFFEGIVQLYAGCPTLHMQNAVKVYLFNQQDNGFTKRAIMNGYSGEEDYEMVKPFLSNVTLLCLKKDGNLDWLDEELFLKLEKSLDYWLFERDPNKNRLSRWRSSVETGMDDQHERGGVWRSDYCEGVDLNSYLVRECLAFARIAVEKNDLPKAEAYRQLAQQRKEAVQQLWDEEDGMFYDRDERTGERIKVKSVSCFTPLWAGIATKEQAERMVKEHILNPDEFWRAYPLPALAASEPGYGEAYQPGDLGCCWRANTWIPTNYYVFESLRMYGYDELAKNLAETTCENVRRIGDREYYATESKTGCGLDPFWGWSLLAYFMPYEAASGYDPTRIGFQKNDHVLLK